MMKKIFLLVLYCCMSCFFVHAIDFTIEVKGNHTKIYDENGNDVSRYYDYVAGYIIPKKIRYHSLDEAFDNIDWSWDDYLPQQIRDTSDFEKASEKIIKQLKKYEPIAIFSDSITVYKLVDNMNVFSGYTTKWLISDVIVRYPDGSIMGGVIDRVKKGHEESVSTAIKKYNEYVERTQNYATAQPGFKQDAIVELIPDIRDSLQIIDQPFPYSIFLGFKYGSNKQKYLIFRGEEKTYQEWKNCMSKTISGTWKGLIDVDHPYYKYNFKADGTGTITYEESFGVTIPQEGGMSWRGRYNKSHQMLTGGYDVVYKSTITQSFKWKITKDSLCLHIHSLSYSPVVAKLIEPSQENCATGQYYKDIVAQCKADFPNNETVKRHKEEFSNVVKSMKTDFHPYDLNVDVIVLTNSVMLLNDAFGDMQFAIKEEANDYTSLILKNQLLGCRYYSNNKHLPIDHYDSDMLDYVMEKVRLVTLLEKLPAEKAAWIKAKKEEEERMRQEKIAQHTEYLTKIAQHFFKKQLSTKDKDLWNDCYNNRINCKYTKDIYCIVDSMNHKFAKKYMPFTYFNVDSCDIDKSIYYCTFISDYKKKYATSIYFSGSGICLDYSFNEFTPVHCEYDDLVASLDSLSQHEHILIEMAKDGAEDALQYYFDFRTKLNISIDSTDYPKTREKIAFFKNYQHYFTQVIERRKEITANNQRIIDNDLTKKFKVICQTYINHYKQYQYYNDSALITKCMDQMISEQQLIYHALTTYNKKDLSEIEKQIKKADQQYDLLIEILKSYQE